MFNSVWDYLRQKKSKYSEDNKISSDNLKIFKDRVNL